MAASLPFSLNFGWQGLKCWCARMAAFSSCRPDTIYENYGSFSLCWCDDEEHHFVLTWGWQPILAGWYDDDSPFVLIWGWQPFYAAVRMTTILCWCEDNNHFVLIWGWQPFWAGWCEDENHFALMWGLFCLSGIIYVLTKYVIYATFQNRTIFSKNAIQVLSHTGTGHSSER